MPPNMPDVQIDNEDSEEWNRIRNFIGGSKKTSKHPLEQENDRINGRQPEMMAEGGETDEFGVPRGSMPQIPTGAPQPPIPAPMPAPMASAPIQPPTAPVGPSGPAPVSDNAEAMQATEAMGGITPEKLQALVDKINSRSRSAQIPAFIAGLGDAVASVGGVHPEAMKGAEALIQQNREDALRAPGMIAAAGKERYQLGKEMGKDDPKSMRSFVAQQSNAPLLKKMGFSDQEIKVIPESMIEGIRTGAISFEDARGKLKLAEAQMGETAQFHRASLDEQEATRKMTERNQQSQGEIAKEGKRGEAARALGNKPFFKSILDMVPGTAGHEATEELKRQMKGDFDHSAIQPGQLYQAPDGTWRKKR